MLHFTLICVLNISSSNYQDEIIHKIFQIFFKDLN